MKKYTTIYNDIKNKILNKELVSGDKILSVRKASKIYNVSITTVQNAYFDLCADGYIISQEKRGYYVSNINSLKKSNNVIEKVQSNAIDLAGGAVDAESFDFALWQRYIKSALRQKERLLSYSEPLGEYDLRCAIAQYISKKRNITAPPERIVIGAGVSPLLNILCSIIGDKKTVSFPNESFKQGIGIFNDYGFDVHTRDKDAEIIYVSPSHMTRWGDVMPIKRRLELIEYSQKNNSLVIEDDYENEFLYNVKPTPSLYTLGHGNIIYIGSFSAMLLPGIRISFMVLTEDMISRFNSKSYRFAQTASKTEQIALCNYIRDGHINAQIRKTRRLYTAKTKDFCQILKMKFPNAKIEIGENTLQIIFKCKFNKDIDVFEKNNLKVFVEKYENDEIVLVISPSAISAKDMDDVADKLKSAIY